MALQKRRDKDPDSPPDRERALRLLNRAANLLRQRRTAQAIPLLERALEIDPHSVPALLNLGGAFVLAGRFKEAIPLLEAARDREPDNAMIWVNLGAAYLGNPVLANPVQQVQSMEAFQTAVDLDPAAPNAYYNLGLIRKDRGEVKEALMAFRQACIVDPRDRDARTWIAKLEGEDSERGHTQS